MSAGNVEDRREYREKLLAAVELMEFSHIGLTKGSQELGLPSVMSASVSSQYFEPPHNVDLIVRHYLSDARMLLELPEQDYSSTHPDLLEILALGPGRLLSSLDRVVRQYQVEGEASVARIALIEMIVWMMALSLLVLEILLIFRPMVRNVVRYVDALRASEARFKSISGSSSVAIIMAFDDAGKVIFWNTAAENAFGYSEQEVLGKGFKLLIPERFREAHSFADYHAQSVETASTSREMIGLHKNGHEFPMELAVGSWWEDNRTFVSAVAQDITGRKQAEQASRESETKYSRLVETAQDLIWQCDKRRPFHLSEFRVGKDSWLQDR